MADINPIRQGVSPLQNSSQPATGSSRRAVIHELDAMNETVLKMQFACSKRMTHGVNLYRSRSDEQSEQYKNLAWRNVIISIIGSTSKMGAAYFNDTLANDVQTVLSMVGVNVDPVGVLNKICSAVGTGSDFGGVISENYGKADINTKDVHVKLTQQLEMEEPRAGKDFCTQKAYTIEQAADSILRATQQGV